MSSSSNKMSSAASARLAIAKHEDDMEIEDDTAPGVGSGSTAPKEHTAPGVGSGSSAPMDIVELAPRDPQCSLFDGASCESQKPLLKGHCTFCGRTFEHPSMVAYFLQEEGRPFAKVKQIVCEKVFGGKVVNVWDDREVFAGCAFCAQTWHQRDPPYVTEIVKDGKPFYKLTNEWTRLKNGSNGKTMSKHHASLACRLHDMKNGLEDGAPVVSADLRETF